MAVMPIGNIAAGDLFLYENKCRLKHQFIGDARGVRKIRIQIKDSAGAFYTDINNIRVFIECFMTVELRM